MTLLMNLIFAQPCWQLSCLSGWEEQVFAELELGALALWPKLNPFAACFLILWRRWQAISLVARPLRKRVVVNHPWFELMRPPGNRIRVSESSRLARLGQAFSHKSSPSRSERNLRMLPTAERLTS